MTPTPELDPETKARIEAEEVYRASVRQRLAGGSRPEKTRAVTTASPAPAAMVTREKMNPLLLLVLGLAALWLVLNLVKGYNSANNWVATPVGIEIQTQNTPDNYGVDMYLKLKSADGAEIKGTGQARIEFYEESYDKPDRLLWSQSYPVKASDFSRGTQGMGAFQRDATFVHLGRVNSQTVGKSSGSSVSVRASFVPSDSSSAVALVAKESALLP